MSETKSVGPVRRVVTRVLATGALLVVYAVSTFAVSTIVMTSGSTPAMAQRGQGRGGGRGGGRGAGRGGGRGGVVLRGRGGGRGRGRGRGWSRGGIWFPWIGPGICHHPYTSARVVCPLW
jgi:hypothetical protein